VKGLCDAFSSVSSTITTGSKWVLAEEEARQHGWIFYMGSTEKYTFEQFLAKGLQGCLVFFGGIILPIYVGIRIHHYIYILYIYYKDPY